VIGESVLHMPLGNREGGARGRGPESQETCHRLSPYRMSGNVRDGYPFAVTTEVLFVAGSGDGLFLPVLFFRDAVLARVAFAPARRLSAMFDNVFNPLNGTGLS
jgi:hypothetical protein